MLRYEIRIGTTNLSLAPCNFHSIPLQPIGRVNAFEGGGGDGTKWVPEGLRQR